MLFNLLVPLDKEFPILNLFRYLTFRSGGAVFTSLILTFYIGPKVIRWLKELKFGQEYADKAEEAVPGHVHRPEKRSSFEFESQFAYAP